MPFNVGELKVDIRIFRGKSLIDHISIFSYLHNIIPLILQIFYAILLFIVLLFYCCFSE